MMQRDLRSPKHDLHIENCFNLGELDDGRELENKKKNNFISSIWDFSAFARNSMYATHSFHIWRGKLIPQLVSKIIDHYSRPGDLILDNFCGSGTTLVESKVKDRNCLGIDVSPLACLISNVKSTLIDKDEILKSFKEIENKFRLHSKQKTLQKFNEHEEVKIDISTIPDPEKWFDLNQLNEIIVLREIINKIDNEPITNFFIVALSAILKQVAKVHPMSIDHIVSVKTKKKEDVWVTFQKKVRSMIDGISEYKELCKQSRVWTQSIVGDSRDLSKISLPNKNIDFDKESVVDLIISHPPYLGNVSYPAIAKLSTWILGNDFAPDKVVDMSSRRLEIYLENMNKVIKEMYRVLKPGKYAAIIIGDTRQNGLLIPTSSHIISVAESLGFQLIDIFIWILWGKAGMKVKRRGNYIDHNYILILKKPDGAIL